MDVAAWCFKWMCWSGLDISGWARYRVSSGSKRKGRRTKQISFGQTPTSTLAMFYTQTFVLVLEVLKRTYGMYKFQL